jgi:hypothetical protein
MKKLMNVAGGLTVAAVLSLVLGCPPSTPPGSGKPTTTEQQGDHGDHGPGPHGGAVGDWGGGKLHFEFIVDHVKKEATVYILGSDEKTATPIKAKDGKITAKIKGVMNKDEFSVDLEAKDADAAGKTSKFVGKHDKIGVVQEFEGSVIGEADGTPYKGDFKEEPPKK